MAREMIVELVGLSEEGESHNGNMTRKFSGWVQTNQGRLWVTGNMTVPSKQKQSKTGPRYEQLFK